MLGRLPIKLLRERDRNKKEMNAMLFRIRIPGWWHIGIALCIAIFATQISILVYATGLGGYVSERLIGRQGVSSSLLLIERQGVVSSDLDMGMAPTVSTSIATSLSLWTPTQATLNGNLLAMKGFPSANVYFQWGYDTNYGNNTTTQVMNTIGTFSATINGFDAPRVVHFRTVAIGDGTHYGADQSFQLEGSISNAYRLAAILPIIFLSIVILAVAVLAITENIGLGVLIIAVVGILIAIAGLSSIQAALNALWGG